MYRVWNRLLTVCFASLLIFSAAHGQTTDAEKTAPKKVDYPDADIFLFELSLADDKLSIVKGKNVTDRPGYENQPFFTKDSKTFLFTQSDDYQTDIFEYDIASGKATQITKTKWMEFSPTPSPDNSTIAFVTDGEGANQSIWHIKRDAPDNPVWTLKAQPEREPVGYFSWNHQSDSILFWSRYGFCMKLAHASKPQNSFIIGHAVPTTPQIIPGTDFFSFVHRQTNGATWIKELNPETKAIRPIAPIVGNNAHYGWAPDGSIIQIEGTQLHRWTKTDGWQKVADLVDHGMSSANRVAVSPDFSKLAVVGLPTTDESK